MSDALSDAMVHTDAMVCTSALPVVSMHGPLAPLSDTRSNAQALPSKRQQRSQQRQLNFKLRMQAARWPNLVHRLLHHSRVRLRGEVVVAWQRLRRTREKIRRALWDRWTDRHITLERWKAFLLAGGDPGGIASTDYGRDHPVGFEVLAPLSPRDIFIYRRATAFVLACPPGTPCRIAADSSRHVLDWLRVPSEPGPHWSHQWRISIIDGAESDAISDGESEEEDEHSSDAYSDEEGW
jgi:hypothetical protein